VLLNATIIDPTTGSLYTTYPVNVTFCSFNSNGSVTTLGYNCSNIYGVALYTLTYPTDGNAYAYNATIVSCQGAGEVVQNVGSSPVQLTVGQPDELVSGGVINLTSTKREIDYWFTDPNSFLDLNLPSRVVQVYVNGTFYNNYTTDAGGDAECDCNLPPVNNSTTTYVITANFAGDNPISESVMATTLDGTNYAACNTFQYNWNVTSPGYEPSSNVLVFSVTPQSVLAAEANQTIQQIERQAESNGSLKIWVTFGGGVFTWLKTHVMVTVGWLNLTISLWAGFPVGAGVDKFTGLQNMFAQAFQSVPDASVSSYEKTLVNTIITVSAAFVGGMTTTFWSEFTPYYPLALGAYALALSITIAGFYMLADTNLCRTVLFGTAGALLGFVVSLLDLPALTDLQAQLSSDLSGTLTPTGIQGVLEIFNCLLNDIVKVVASAVGYGCWLSNQPFIIVSCALGLLALSLAIAKT
jgi:hypothetical protein